VNTSFIPPLEKFYHWERTIPQQVWLSQPQGGTWRHYTWREAGSEIRQLAGAFTALGVKLGDRVGIYAANSARWVMADLAIMMAGGVSVPIYSSMPEDKLRYVVEHSGLDILLADDQGALTLESLEDKFSGQVKILSLTNSGGQENWLEMQENFMAIEGSPVRDAHDLWSISYTSGTTGMPKGVMHSFSSMPFSASQIKTLTGANKHSRFFSFLPLAHMAERSVVELHSIYTGASIAFNESKETFIADLQTVRPTFFFSVPRIWHNLKSGILAGIGEEKWSELLQSPDEARAYGQKVLTSMGLDNVTFAFSGSAPISPKDIEAWRALGMPICEGFGQTETMSGTCNRPDKYKIGSVGLLMGDEAEVKISSNGEILMRSQGNMLGYYNEPEKTAETLVDGWVHTGDKGRIDEDGFLFITGRVKDIFKTAKGKYVAPAPIEHHFTDVPYFDQVCLVGRGMPQTMLLAVSNASLSKRDKALISEALNSKLKSVNDKLEAHERLSHIIVCREPWTIENKLLTHTLKTLRDDVENKYREVIDRCAEEQLKSVVWAE